MPEGWLEEGLDDQGIRSIYPFPYKIVDYEEWKESIIQRKEGYVYSIIAPYPTAEAYVYPLFIVDCKAGRVKAVYWPLTSGIFGVSALGSNSAYITRFSLEKLTEIITNDIQGE